ncbi:hypothetical protein C5O80_38415 [Burkholderia sp. SRS-46]|nr:hypothetical protein C5O80_38415 [Burkholderia sp. SRS-46]
MNTHAIAAALAAVSLSALAQPGMSPSGSPPPAPSRADVTQAAAHAPAPRGFVLAKIDQNNTPPDRGGDPSGRQHAGTRM